MPRRPADGGARRALHRVDRQRLVQQLGRPLRHGGPPAAARRHLALTSRGRRRPINTWTRRGCAAPPTHRRKGIMVLAAPLAMWLLTANPGPLAASPVQDKDAAVRAELQLLQGSWQIE